MTINYNVLHFHTSICDPDQVSREIYIHIIFDSCEKCEYVIISVGPAKQVIVRCGKNFNVAIFSHYEYDNVKLCMMVLLTKLYLFVPFSVTLIIFQGHSSLTPKGGRGCQMSPLSGISWLSFDFTLLSPLLLLCLLPLLFLSCLFFFLPTGPFS